MTRNIASAHLIVERAVSQEVQQFTTRHIVLGIHHVEVACLWIYDNAIRHLHLRQLWGCRQLRGHHLMSADVDDAIGLGVRIDKVERVSNDTQVANADIQLSTHTELSVCLRLQPQQRALLVGIIATRGDP